MNNTGCLFDQEKKEKVWASLPCFAIDNSLLLADDDADIFLFDAEKVYLDTLRELEMSIPWPTSGLYLTNHRQLGNDCTSHAASGSMEDTQMVDIVWRCIGAEFFPIASEPLYGGAVVTIMSSSGDLGAYTHAPLEYAEQFGYLARKNYNGVDLTTYDINKVKQYSQTGVPQELISSESKHLLKTKIPVHTYEEGSAFLRQGYAIVGGSSQGFSPKRDKDGFCAPEGIWRHCTRYRGRRGGTKPGWAYGQSWGPSMPSGPLSVTLDSGRLLELPVGTFFVDPDTINSMIPQGEFYAVSSQTDFTLLDYKLW